MPLFHRRERPRSAGSDGGLALDSVGGVRQRDPALMGMVFGVVAVVAFGAR